MLDWPDSITCMAPKLAPLAPIGRMDVFRQVLAQLVAYIDNNGLQPGDRLPGDRELVAALQVSRPLVQQALKVLEGLGRVTIQQGLGTFVADNGLNVAASELLRGLEPGQGLSSQVLLARQLVDEQVIRAAYQNNSAKLIDELRQVLEHRSAELAQEPDEASLSLGFEATFGRFCDNPVLSRLQTLLHHAWLQVQIDEIVQLADRFALHRQHQEILESLQRNDLDKALDLFNKHMRGLRP
jgi:GntR family transcriptional regulator, transcriptional repressor for pyruvate dehydrogenase complex